MGEQSTRQSGEGSYFFGGIVILLIGAGFLLAGWLGYLTGEGAVQASVVGLVGTPVFLFGTYIAVLGAAKIER